MLNMLSSLRSIITTVLASIQQTSLLILLLMLIIFIYSCLGMQLFAGTFVSPPLESMPREHFDHFSAAFLTVFKCLTGEWNNVMYLAMAATSDVSCLFFITLFFIANYIVLNLFIAVLLQNFEEEAESGADAGEEAPVNKESMKALLPDTSLIIAKQQKERLLHQQKQQQQQQQQRSPSNSNSDGGDDGDSDEDEQSRALKKKPSMPAIALAKMRQSVAVATARLEETAKLVDLDYA
eukprot:TRINITY_DN7312_c0_g1_i7.p1 TRINITY_DN7312_c0_g1~~TRINITY_DN7312_c0_g1_i7.p1  ORF type:complete len:237 (-),score=84.63 TRINITY_DN7312_c0_g1_i7:279-989(-)